MQRVIAGGSMNCSRPSKIVQHLQKPQWMEIISYFTNTHLGCKDWIIVPRIWERIVQLKRRGPHGPNLEIKSIKYRSRLMARNNGDLDNAVSSSWKKKTLIFSWIKRKNWALYGNAWVVLLLIKPPIHSHKTLSPQKHVPNVLELNFELLAWISTCLPHSEAHDRLQTLNK